MKRALLIVALCLCLVGASFGAEPNAPKSRAMTLWVSASSLGYQNTDMSVMLGIRNKNIEVGIDGEWRMFSEGDIEGDAQSDFALGPYAAYHFPDLIDVNMPGDVSWLPEKLMGEPFISLAYPIDLEGKGAAIKPGVGIRLFDIFAVKWEYAFYKGIPADNEGQVGISAKWEF